MISTVVLRITAIVAGFSVILLRAWMDPRLVFLTLLFYLTPYLFIVFAPRRLAPTQIGFAVGLAVSMQVAVIVLMIVSLGFNPPGTSPPSPWVFNAQRYVNTALAVAGIVAWIWSRKSIDHSTAGPMVVVGLVYPFLAFFLEIFIGGTIYR